MYWKRPINILLQADYIVPPSDISSIREKEASSIIIINAAGEMYPVFARRRKL